MRKIIFLVCLIVLTGCSTQVVLSDMRPQGEEIPNKIKPLLFSIPYFFKLPTYHSSHVAENEDKFKIVFERTLEKNVFNFDKDKWGYVVLKSTYYENLLTGYWAGIYIHSQFLGVPSLLGLPIYGQKLNMEFEVNIYNSNKELIKTYILQQSGKQFTGLYYNWPRLNYLSFFHKMLRELEDEINNDADYINSELEKAGKINP